MSARARLWEEGGNVCVCVCTYISRRPPLWLIIPTRVLPSPNLPFASSIVPQDREAYLYRALEMLFTDRKHAVEIFKVRPLALCLTYSALCSLVLGAQGIDWI